MTDSGIPVEIPEPIIRRTPITQPGEVELFAVALHLRYERFNDGEVSFYFDCHGRLVGPYTTIEAGMMLEGIEIERDRIRQAVEENVSEFWETFDPSYTNSA